MNRRTMVSLFVLLSLQCFASLPQASADWPMYRSDAARTGYTTDALPTELSPRWIFKSPLAPKPAWPRSTRMNEDWSYQPVVMGDQLFFGSSSDGKVYAVDVATGQVNWTFATDAPIRFAPAAWNGRVFVGSDDGCLYALDIDDGRLLWKHRGGPSDRSVLGNERIISKWPARGGAVILDGLVYYAAGIWPSEGIFLYALDAETGDVAWTNDSAGGLKMPQPHPTAVAESGVAAQGYLVATNDRILMPTGRAVPAAFNRNDGAFDYFHLQAYGQNGGSRTVAVGEIFFNGGYAFDLATGTKLFSVGNGPIAATPDGLVVRAGGESVSAYKLVETTKPDRRGNPTKATELQLQWTTPVDATCSALIIAGGQAVVGGSGLVSTLDLETGDVTWTAECEGTAHGLAATVDGLFVSTDLGAIYAFGPAGESVEQSPSVQASGTPYEESSLASIAANEIIERTGIIEGYCIDLGCGDGELAYHLARKTNLFIFAIDDDAERVALARERLTAAGLYGSRVTVHHRELQATGFPSYMADLVVSGRSVASGEGVVPNDEAARLQRPHGGIVCLGRPGAMRQTKRGALKGEGRWTHQYADPANTICSGDQFVRGRLGMLWFRDVDFDVPSRHGRAPAPLYDEGRLFNAGMHGLIAVDAYNGRVLWRYEIENLLTAYDGDELMGTAGTGGVFCVGEGSVYVRHEGRCIRLDAATGKELAVFEAPKRADGKASTWGYLAFADGMLFGSLANADHIVTYRYVNRGGDMTRLLTESDTLFAMDAETGRMQWRYEAQESIRHNTLAIADGKVLFIDRPIALFDRVKRPSSKQHALGTVVALDAETGTPVWRREDMFGTMLAAGAKHNVLLMSYQPTRFKLDSEIGGRMAGLDLSTGETLWEIQADYQSRPIINDRTIYAQGGAWDLLDGSPVPFEFQRSYGCGILASGAHMLLFRSATLGYYDLSGARRTENYGGIRPACWINTLPVGGIVLVPDATAGCVCSYLNKAWFALEPLSEPTEH